MKSIYWWHFLSTDSSKMGCVPFIVDNKKVGLVPQYVQKELQNYPHVFETANLKGSDKTVCVNLSIALDSVEKRDEALAEVLEDLRSKNAFVSLKGWRDEVNEMS